MPVIEDCLWNIRGGELFSKLDIKGAYNHVPVRQEDQLLLTINTHKGLFKFTRLPYGVSSASAIFQSIMDQVLAGIPGVACRVDDILVTGKNDAEHMSNLREVVCRLERAGFRCRLDKTVFMQPEVIYIGHRITKQGCSPVKSKVETIVKAPYPKSREELISFLGMIQYYSRYLPDLHSVIEPLNRLRSKSVPWQFNDAEKSAFDRLKTLISSDRVLTFYDPDLPLRLDTDASAVGLGAVLSHVINGVDRPIEFVSRTLKSAERNYSQIEREALAIVWSVRKFHRYLYARKFVLCTDHKPLEMIFDPYKALSEVASSRIQRWGMFLTSYRYTVEFRPTGKHANADMCSRFPLAHDQEPDLEEIGEVFFVDAEFSVLSVTLGDDKPLLNCKLLAKATRVDPILSKVVHCVLEGWPENTEKKPDHASSRSHNESEMKVFWSKRNELSVDSGCLMWGSRVVIPIKMREDILKMLHSTHMGMCSMKSLARGYLWWPGLDREIERVAKKCEACNLNQRLPNRVPPHPWQKPSGPWERIHVDFAGVFLGYMWLLVVDAYSKWLEVFRMSIGATKTSDTIKVLRSVFCRYGLPKSCVSDGGPQFISEEMKTFMKRNGIHHTTSPPYHPASNGQAESLVGKFKVAMKKMKHSNPDIMLNLQNWLMSYRNTPHSFTGVEPSVLMMGRRSRTALSLLHPLHQDNNQPKSEVDTKSQPQRMFEVGDKVLFWNVLKKTWTPGVVTKLEGSRVLNISSQDGTVRKHLDHVVGDSTDLQTTNLPPTQAEGQSESELLDRHCVDKSRCELDNGLKPKLPNEHNHGPIDLPIESRSSTDMPEQIVPKPSSSTDRPEKIVTKPSFNTDRPEQIVPKPSSSTDRPEQIVTTPSSITDRPKRNTRQPSRLQYNQLGG